MTDVAQRPAARERTLRLRTIVLAAMLAVPVALGSPAIARAAEQQPAAEASSPPRFKASTGDPDLKLRHRLRVLVPYDQTLFFVDRGKQYGVLAVLGRRLEGWINRTHRARGGRVTVDLVPVARDHLLPALAAGEGDVAAADLAVTDDRLVEVDFTDPWMTGVADVVVTGPASRGLRSIDDLAGAEIAVRRSSPHAAELARLNETLTAKGREPITVLAADESLEDEDLMIMVNAGLLPMTVVDEHRAALWAQLLPALAVHTDLAVGTIREVAWAVRKGSPELRATLGAFLKSRAAAIGSGEWIKRRAFAHLPLAGDAYGEEPVRRFDDTLDLFRRVGDEYGIDGLLLAGLGYQESQLDQSRRGPGGALGIMQLMPATAANPDVSVDGADTDPERNIEAGTRYLRGLIDGNFDDPAIDAKNRMLMAVAAYRAGPGEVARFRKAAAQAGLDPNVWFDNVENGAARVAGRGIVQYVKTVYEYAVAYRMLVEREKR